MSQTELSVLDPVDSTAEQPSYSQSTPNPEGSEDDAVDID
jgi:hypothetical protein